MTRSLFSTGSRRVAAVAIVSALVGLPHLSYAQRAGRAAAAVKPASLAIVRGVSRSSLPRGERITVEISDEVRYAFERVPGPDRVYFDFSGATVAAPVVAAAQSLGPGPIITAIRLARHSEQTARLVLTLGANARYSAFPMYNPFRVVIDVETDGPPAGGLPAAAPPARAPANTVTPVVVPPEPPNVVMHADTDSPDPPSTPRADTAPVDAAPPPAPAPPPAAPSLKTRGSIGLSSTSGLSAVAPAATLPRGDYSLARQLGLRVARIVIDAGHGGHDPGAQSNGITESELVLDVALRLEQLLRAQPGIEVVLTRRTDEFIPLEERTAIANREGADLFLSIHANASRQTGAQGIETYFLNFATNPAAEAVAARENATSARTMGNLPELVKTIALNNKVVESRELATIVQTSMVRRLRLQNKGVRDLGVKQAPFVVLIGAQMPSVLAEISFITNRSDAALLKQGTYRQRVAQSLSDAVVRYQGSLKKATTAAVAVKSLER